MQGDTRTHGVVDDEDALQMQQQVSYIKKVQSVSQQLEKGKNKLTLLLLRKRLL
jgi:hypothetical protein